MALPQVIQNLDFRQPAQRLVASSACIAVNALAIGLGAAATPAGILAAALAGVGLNVLSADFHNAMSRRLGRAKQVFRNHDLTHVVGKAIGLVIERAAGDRKLADDSSALRKLSVAAPEYWATLAPLTATDETLEPLSEENLTRFVAVTADEFESLTALDVRTWENFVRALAEIKKITLRPGTFPRLASELNLSYPTALREVLKNDFATDGRAYASLQMLVWGETLAAMTDLSQQIAANDTDSRRAYDVLLKTIQDGLTKLRDDYRDFIKLEVVDALTSSLEVLSQNVAAGFAENRELHVETHGRLGQIQTQLVGVVDLAHSHRPITLPPGEASAMAPSIPSPVQPPPRNPRFLPRADLDGADFLKKLHEKPKTVHRVVLHGMSGVGKTQVVLEYAHHFWVDRSTHKEVYWTAADTEEQFLVGLSGIAGRLNLPTDRPPTEILGAIHARLEAADDWLWVIDNAYNPSDIARKYLPKPQSGRVLLTTTRAEPEVRGINALVVELTRFLDPVDGARFLAALFAKAASSTTFRNRTRKLPLQ